MSQMFDYDDINSTTDSECEEPKSKKSKGNSSVEEEAEKSANETTEKETTDDSEMEKPVEKPKKNVKKDSVKEKPKKNAKKEDSTKEKPKKNAKKEDSAKKDAKNNGGAKESSALAPMTDDEGNQYFDIGRMRRVAISGFKGKSYVNIREYYDNKDGKMLPGKKGISLNQSEWKNLLSIADQLKFSEE